MWIWGLLVNPLTIDGLWFINCSSIIMALHLFSLGNISANNINITQTDVSTISNVIGLIGLTEITGILKFENLTLNGNLLGPNSFVIGVLSQT